MREGMAHFQLDVWVREDLHDPMVKSIAHSGERENVLLAVEKAIGDKIADGEYGADIIEVEERT